MPNMSFERSVLERLALCGVDFGLKRAWDVPPKKKVQREDLPCAYGLVGATYSPIVQSPGQLVLPRTYTQRILVALFDGAPDKFVQGNEALVEANEWTTLPHFYYAAHPQLATTNLPKLNGCKAVEQTSDTGVVFRRAPGGSWAVAIDVLINVLMSGNVQIAPSNYSA